MLTIMRSFWDNTMIFNKDTKHRVNRPYVLSLSKDALYFSKSKEASLDSAQSLS
jgi:hypothetical protein